jgi:hypothetical protein
VSSFISRAWFAATLCAVIHVYVAMEQDLLRARRRLL